MKTQAKSSLVEPCEWNGATVTAQVELVTPDTAARWLEEGEYENQRRLRVWHVDELIYALQHNQFKPGAIEFYHHGNRAYLTDGQHRLSAITRSGLSALLVVVRVHVRTMEEVAAAYYRTDCGVGRSLDEAIPISGVMERTGLGIQQIKVVERATRFINYGLHDKRRGSRRHAERNRDIRLMAVQAWASEAQAYFKAIGDPHEIVARRMFDQPVVAVGLVTFRYQAELAQRFWSRVAANDGLRRGMPEHVAFGVLATQAEKQRPHNLYARLLAVCFNAAHDKRDLFNAVCRDEKKPILIKGTPYDGTRVLRYNWDLTLEEGEEETRR